jgi:exopolysaccharide production protein ExoZ
MGAAINNAAAISTSLTSSVSRRPPASRLSSIEALRVSAVLLVIFYHVHTIMTPIVGKMPFGGFFQSGSSRGVDIFFVLSGFAIVWTYAGEVGRPARWRSFMAQRLLRIYPAAIIMTACAAMLYASGFGGPDKAAKLEPGNLILSFIMMAERSSSVLNVAWTLKYIIFFYGLFGLAIIDLGVGIFAIGLWQIGILLHTYAHLGGGAWDDYFLQPMGLEFGFGIICALLLKRVQNRLSSQAARRLLLVGLIGFIACKLTESFIMHADLSPSVEVWPFGLSSAAMLVGLAVLDLRGAVRFPPICVTLGVASFSVYLVNYSAIVLGTKAIQSFGIDIGGDLIPYMIAGAAFGCGLLFYILVDKPIQRAIKRMRKHIGKPAT